MKKAVIRQYDSKKTIRLPRCELLSVNTVENPI